VSKSDHTIWPLNNNSEAFRDENCQTILVMVQKEVAKKFCAMCGDKEFSALSVLQALLEREQSYLMLIHT